MPNDFICCTTHYIRQYNTSGAVVRTLTLLDANGVTQIPGRLNIFNGNISFSQGDGNALRIITQQGYVDVGAQNSNYCHFTTGSPKFYFNKPVYVAGELFAGANYNQKVWHAGNDGAGSGLDADLLDGLHGSSYLTVSGYASTLDGRYVNATGDTMTGVLNFNMSNPDPAIWIKQNGTNKGAFGWRSPHGAFIYNPSGSHYLGIANSKPHFDLYTLYHENNAGNFYSWSRATRNSYQVWDLSNTTTYNENVYYPVTIALSATEIVRNEIQVALNSGTKPSWSTHAQGYSVRLAWEESGYAWGTSPIVRKITSAIYNYAGQSPIGGIAQLINSSTCVLWLRGGGKYFYYSNGQRTKGGPYTTQQTIIQQTFTTRTLDEAKQGWHEITTGWMGLESQIIWHPRISDTISLFADNNVGAKINFYWNGRNKSVTSHTSRLYEAASGRLSIPGKLAVGAAGINDSYALSATSFYSSGNITTSSNITASGYIQSTSRIISGYDNNAYWISTKSLIVQNQSVHNGGISTTSVSSSSRSTFSGGITAQYSNTTYSISCDTIIANHENVSNYFFERRTYPGSSWNRGYGAYNIELMNNGSQTPLCVAYRSGKNAAATGTDRVFAIEILNSNGNVHFCIGGVERFEFNPSGQLTAQGNIISKGEVTAYSTSDMRLKKDICEVRCDEASYILSKVRPVKYKWNEKAFELNSNQRYKGEEYGIIAQELQPIVPCAIKTVFEEYLSIDYTRLIPPIIAVVNEHELEIQRLKTEVEELKSRLEVLNCMR